MSAAAAQADAPAGLALPSLSVVIPALEAAASLAGCLEALREALPGEIWLVDGGSRDETRSIAAAAGCRLAAARRGRGRQLRAGAALARGPWLLFLHADTRLSGGWSRQVADFIQAVDAPVGAAVFRLRLDSGRPAARRVECLANRRARLLGLPYGDQGLLIHRTLYDGVGGYPDWPLMEDVALVRALGRRRLRILPCAAVTSAAKYERDGWWLRPLANLVRLSLFLLGVRPERLARRYR